MVNPFDSNQFVLCPLRATCHSQYPAFPLFPYPGSDTKIAQVHLSFDVKDDYELDLITIKTLSSMKDSVEEDQEAGSRQGGCL